MKSPRAGELSGIRLRTRFSPVLDSKDDPVRPPTLGPVPSENVFNDSDKAPPDALENPSTVSSPLLASQSVHESLLMLPTFIARRLGKPVVMLPLNLLSPKQAHYSVMEKLRHTGEKASSMATEVQSLNYNPTSSKLEGTIANRNLLAGNDWHGLATSAEERPKSTVPELGGKKEANTHFSDSPQNISLSSEITRPMSEGNERDPAQPTRTVYSAFPSLRERRDYGSSEKQELGAAPRDLRKSGLTDSTASFLQGAWTNTLRFLHLRDNEPLPPPSPTTVVKAQISTVVARRDEAIGPIRPVHQDPQTQTHLGLVEPIERSGRNLTFVSLKKRTPDYPSSSVESQLPGKVLPLQAPSNTHHSRMVPTLPSLTMIAKQLRVSSLMFPSVPLAAYHEGTAGAGPADTRNVPPRAFSARIQSRNVRDLVSAHADVESSQTSLGYNTIRETGIKQQMPRLDLPGLRRDSSVKAVVGSPFIGPTGPSQITLPGLSRTELPNNPPSGGRITQTPSMIDLPDIGSEDRSSLLELEESDTINIDELRLKISRIFEEEARRYFAGE